MPPDIADLTPPALRPALEGAMRKLRHYLSGPNVPAWVREYMGRIRGEADEAGTGGGMREHPEGQ